MANLNVSNRMVQVLGNQDAQKLVNKILNDGKVDKTDKEDLQALEAMLKSAAEEDGTLDGEEKELIGALTNHSYVLGVNTGTSEAILLDNLKKVQQIQTKFKDMQPSEVAFDGLAITTDGFFSDEVRVVRLRDQVEPPTTQGSETPQTPTETQTGATTGTTTGTPTTPAENTGEGETVNQPPDTADTPPAEEIDPIVPKTQYTPTTAPTAGTPSVEVPPEQAARVAPQEQAYTEAVQELQTEVRAVREMLNDPGQVSNEQLQSSLQSFAESDPTKALTEIKRHNENILEDMKSAGLITDADINAIGNASSLTNQKLGNGNKFGDVLAQYLKDTPLSDQQLNGYRETLVKTADNYIADPSNANKNTLRTELYDNLYVFEKGATPAQEETYRRLSPALDQVDQKQAAFEQQIGVASGESSVLSPNITSAAELAKALANLNSTPQSQIETFAGQMDKVLTYLDENPNQYEGQTEDAAALRSKVAELRNSQDPERKLVLFNELKTDLDEIYIKTDIQKGADGVSQTETLAQLENLKATTSDPNVRQAADFLMQNPELLSSAPKLSEYKTILDSLNNGPQQLTPKQEELKAALESGDVAKVNQMYMNEMFDNMGGFMSSLGGFFGWGASTPSPPETQEPPLPGTWLGASDLAETLQGLSPERRTNIIQALQSPEAAQLAQTLQDSPELSQIMGRYSNAVAAKTSIEQAHWSSNSGLEQTQEAIQKQQNQPPAFQAELENAALAIDDLLQNGDLADPVKKRLTEQKQALNQALELIKAGEFTKEAAESLGKAGLDDILSANASRTDSDPSISLKQALKREATLDALAALSENPANLQKMEAALSGLTDDKGNLLYGHVFQKNEKGEYAFPDEMSALLKDSSLDSGALDLAMHQINRSLHVIDSAETRSKATLIANYDQGKKIAEQGQGQRDFYSGYMGLQSIDSIMKASESTKVSNAEIFNSISRNGVQEVLDNPDLSDAEKREQISQLTEQGLEQANQSLVGKVSQENLNQVKETFRNIFESDDQAQRLAKEALISAAVKVNGNIDPSKIQSADDLLNQLDTSQIEELQSIIREQNAAIAGGEYPQEVKNLLSGLSSDVDYRPGMSVEGLSERDQAIVHQANNMLQTAQLSSQIMMGAVSELNPLAEFRTAQSALTERLQGSMDIMQSVQSDARKDLPTNAVSAIFGETTPPEPGSENYLARLEDYNQGLITNANNYLNSDAFKALGPDEQTQVRTLVESVKTSATAILTQAPLMHQVKSGQGLSPEQQNAATTALGLAIAYRDAAANMGAATTTGEVQQEQHNLEETVDAIKTAGANGNFEQPDNASPATTNAFATMNGFYTGTENYNTTVAVVAPLVEPQELMDSEYQDYYKQNGTLPEAPEGISVEEVIENFQGTQDLLVNSPPEVAQQVAQNMLPLLEKQVYGWDEAVESFDDFAIAMDPVVRQLGHPGLDLSQVDNPPASSLSSSSVKSAPPQTAADQRAAELIDKANALADRLVLAPEGENSEEFLMDLINGFINTIRDQDYKTRQLILAQLANQMMTDSITNFYKDKTDKNNKYHQDSIARMAESFQRNIQRTIQESLVSQASDSQSIAAVSGQVGAANTAEAMGIEQLRASSEQLLSEAQKMTPPLITDLQKEKILESLFDNNPNNDAMGIIALAGLSVN